MNRISAFAWLEKVEKVEESDMKLAIARSLKRKRKCGVCRNEGHNARTCKEQVSEEELKAAIENLKSW